MLSIENLNLKYGQKQVLSNLNWSLEAGKIHGLVGLNGAGKTSLLNSLYGTVKAQSGKFEWKKEKLQRKHIAYLQTHPFFYTKITGQEYLKLFEKQNPNFSASNWNQIFELPLRNLVESYSTGMKKKLALLGVLSLDRPIFILDEPAQGLDLESNEILKKIISRLSEKGKTIIITSHILDILWNICDIIHHLQSRKIQNSYTKANFEHLKKDLENYTEQNKITQINHLISL